MTTIIVTDEGFGPDDLDRPDLDREVDYPAVTGHGLWTGSALDRRSRRNCWAACPRSR